MKKLILLSSFFLLLFFSIENLSAGDKIGLRAGYQSANIYTDGDKSDFDNLNSFYFGAYKDNKLLPFLKLGVGAEYFQNGFKNDDDNKVQLHYISIPVYLKAKVGPVYGLAGTGGNILIKKEALLDGNDVIDALDPKVFDMPIYFGGGISFLMFSVEARYHIGMLEINDTGSKNQYLQIGATVSF